MIRLSFNMLLSMGLLIQSSWCFSNNSSCECYSCTETGCIEGSKGGVSYKIWFVDLAGTNTNVAQVQANEKTTLRVSGSVKADGCFGECNSQLIIQGETVSRQLCGTGEWSFDKTISFATPSNAGYYNFFIGQDNSVICKDYDNVEMPEDSDTSLLASMYVQSIGVNDGMTDGDSDDMLSCKSLQCPSICHVVPKKYIPNKSVYHMTYRNLAIGIAVGAAITFALSSHFLKAAVTVSTPWQPPPPSLANAWLGSAAVTVGASLMAEYWLSSACHGYLLNWGAGFSSAGALSCLFMFGFHIHNRCCGGSEKKKRRKRLSSRDVSSDSDHSASLVENEQHISPSDIEGDTDNEEEDEHSRSGQAAHGRRRRRQRGTWIVQVSSAYVRIVSGGLDSLPGVPDDEGDIVVESEEADRENPTPGQSASTIHSDLGASAVGHGQGMHNNSDATCEIHIAQAASCRSAPCEDDIPVANAVAIFV